jgi:hypothetical protein
MKIKLSIFFSLMTFFVVTMSIIETHSFSVVQSEITIESVSEYENAETESIADTAHFAKSSTVLEMYDRSLSFSDESFAIFNLTKDIFRPPRLV